MADQSIDNSRDEYEHYNYEDDKVTGYKGGKHRTKTEIGEHNKKGDNRSNRIHVGNQVNNEEKHREQNLKHPTESSL